MLGHSETAHDPKADDAMQDLSQASSNVIRWLVESGLAASVGCCSMYRRTTSFCQLRGASLPLVDDLRAVIALEQALSAADALDLPGEQWRSLLSLAAVYQARDQADQAQHAQARSAAIIQQLAITFEDAGARAAFLRSASTISSHPLLY